MSEETLLPEAPASPEIRSVLRAINPGRQTAAGFARLLGGNLAGPLGCQIAIQHGPATGAQIGALLDHARRDVRDFGTAEAERIAAAY